MEQLMCFESSESSAHWGERGGRFEGRELGTATAYERNEADNG